MICDTFVSVGCVCMNWVFQNILWFVVKFEKPCVKGRNPLLLHGNRAWHRAQWGHQASSSMVAAATECGGLHGAGDPCQQQAASNVAGGPVPLAACCELQPVRPVAEGGPDALYHPRQPQLQCAESCPSHPQCHPCAMPQSGTGQHGCSVGAWVLGLPGGITGLLRSTLALSPSVCESP